MKSMNYFMAIKNEDYYWYTYFSMGNIWAWKAVKAFRARAGNTSNIIYFSSITLVEIMIKNSAWKASDQWNLIEVAENSGFEALAFNAEDAIKLKDMPMHHKDPFDRMLIAQAMNNKYKLMSEDRKFKLYPCDLVWWIGLQRCSTP